MSVSVKDSDLVTSVVLDEPASTEITVGSTVIHSETGSGGN